MTPSHYPMSGVYWVVVMFMPLDLDMSFSTDETAKLLLYCCSPKCPSLPVYNLCEEGGLQCLVLIIMICSLLLLSYTVRPRTLPVQKFSFI